MISSPYGKKIPWSKHGESASVTGRRHIPARVFKQAVNLSKQTKEIEILLSDTNPFSAEKYKEEAIALLHKFFPGMEHLEGHLRKYQREIGSLGEEKFALEKQIDDAKSRIKDRLEAGKLQQEVQFLRQFYTDTPDEYKGTSLANIIDNDVQQAVNLINNRPRKRLGFKSPNEMLLYELEFCCT